MAACKIATYVVPMMDQYGRLYASGPSTSQSKCDSHGWMFTPGEPMWGDKLCPIGQIEAARDEAIEAIAAAKGSK